MVADVVAQLGPIDVLVNSAGAAKRTAPDDLTAQAWHDAMDAKFFSYVHPLDIVVKQMAARGRGVIVNIIGMGGKVANPIHLPGGAANAALMLATAGLAAAYGPKGVRVNAISPGTTLTGRVQEGLAVEAKMTGTPEAELLAQAAGEDSAAARGNAGGSGAGRAVPGVGRGELRHRCDHSDGRGQRRGHLTRSCRLAHEQRRERAERRACRRAAAARCPTRAPGRPPRGRGRAPTPPAAAARPRRGRCRR